jgi:hypothetical protein
MTDTHQYVLAFSLAIGLKCKDGVVLAVEKIVQSKLLVKGANRRIMSLDNHVGMVSPNSAILGDNSRGLRAPVIALDMTTLTPYMC